MPVDCMREELTVKEIVEKLGLGKATDDEVLTAVQVAVIECTQSVMDYKNGNDRAIHSIIGKVMKITRGRADAGEAHRLIIQELKL